MTETIAPAKPGRAMPDEPGERECLRCYLGRMLAQHGCDNTRTWTIRWRDRRAPGNKRLLDELADRGGLCCDCEVVINVWESDDYEDAEDDVAPGNCLGSGSKDPLVLCARWAGLVLSDPHDYEDDWEEDPEGWLGGCDG